VDLGSAAPLPDVSIRQISFVAIIGQGGGGNAEFTRPQGLAVDPEGRVYVADTGNDRIQLLDADGRFLARAGGFGWDTGQFNKPTDLCVNNNLETWVVDSRNRRLQQFDARLNLVAVYRPQDYAAADATFGTLYGIGLARDGGLYVSDPENETIYQFNPFGDLRAAFASFGRGQSHVQGPAALSVDRRGTIYVCDYIAGRVTVFDPFGNFMLYIGAGELDGPYGVAVDDDGLVYVADTRHHRVVVFDATGGVAATLGAMGSGPASFSEPHDVAVTWDGYLYVADTGNNRIQKFRVDKNRH
jgi:DNA-binding beta-propeller fold protein YncE